VDRTKTILLVEDNQDDELLTLLAFKEGNLANQITVARDGVEALDYLFATGPYAGRGPIEPTLVLLDLKLPKVDGLEVLRRMRADERTKKIPVVILTTSGEEQDLKSGYRLGCNSYVRKPVDMAGFMDAIRQLGLYWLVLNEPPPPR
jgi:CheY-like chemotaxis protein